MRKKDKMGGAGAGAGSSRVEHIIIFSQQDY